jgi:hypothetical protein
MEAKQESETVLAGVSMEQGTEQKCRACVVLRECPAYC